MTKNPKQKGSENERKIAKKLSLWFSDGKNPNIFWRSQSSGGRSTQLSKTNTPFNLSFGDIGLSSGEGESVLRCVSFELKHGYPELSIMGILDKKRNPLFLTFWDKLVLECEKAEEAGWGKEPLLIIQRNRCQPLVAMDYEFSHEMVLAYGVPKVPAVIYCDTKRSIRIIRLDDFLSWIPPQFFIKKWNSKES